MSSMDIISGLKQAQAQQDRSEQFLTPDERDVVKRLLAFPEEFPPEFGTWLVDYLGTVGITQQYQVQGLPLLNSQVQDALQQVNDQLVVVNAGYVATQETCSSDSFVDLATVGPTVTGLADGVYLVLFGAAVVVPSGTNFGTMTVYANSDTPGETNAFVVGGDVASGSAGAFVISSSRAVSMSLSNNDNNTISTKYHKGGSSAQFGNRWLTALRLSSA